MSYKVSSCPTETFLILQISVFLYYIFLSYKTNLLILQKIFLSYRGGSPFVPQRCFPAYHDLSCPTQLFLFFLFNITCENTQWPILSVTSIPPISLCFAAATIRDPCCRLPTRFTPDTQVPGGGSACDGWSPWGWWCSHSVYRLHCVGSWRLC